MINAHLPLSVARLVVAAAWADGVVTEAERRYLRRRFQDMSGITGADWAELNELLEKPMSAEAQEGALRNVIEAVQTKEDKAFVLSVVVELVAADETVTPEELELVQQVKAALDSRPTSVLRRVSRLVGGLLRGPSRSGS